MVAVPRRSAVRGAAAGIGIAHVDRGVEVLGPDAHDRRVVAGLGVGPQVLQSVRRELEPVGQDRCRREVDLERLVEVAVRRHVELLLLADVGLDPERLGRRPQRRDRVRRAVEDQPVVDDPGDVAVVLERREPAVRRLQDDLAVHEPLGRRDGVDGEPVQIGQRPGVGGGDRRERGHGPPRYTRFRPPGRTSVSAGAPSDALARTSP